VLLRGVGDPDRPGAELKALAPLADDGLVELESGWINVTARGRLVVRAVCMVFDRYLRAAQERGTYSRIV